MAPKSIKTFTHPHFQLIVGITCPIPIEPVKRNESWCNMTAALKQVRKSAAALAPLDCRTWDTMGCMKYKTRPCLKRNN